MQLILSWVVAAGWALRLGPGRGFSSMPYFCWWWMAQLIGTIAIAIPRIMSGMVMGNQFMALSTE